MNRAFQIFIFKVAVPLALYQIDFSNFKLLTDGDTTMFMYNAKAVSIANVIEFKTSQRQA